jgi:hypothetical protein
MSITTRYHPRLKKSIAIIKIILTHPMDDFVDLDVAKAAVSDGPTSDSFTDHSDTEAPADTPTPRGHAGTRQNR